MTDEHMIDLTILSLENGGLELWQQDGQDEPDVIDLHPAQIRLLAERAGLLAAPDPKLLDRLSAAHIGRLHALRDRIEEVYTVGYRDEILERCSHGAEISVHLRAISDLADELIADLAIADGAQSVAGTSAGLLLVVDTETTGLPRWDLPADDPSQPRVVDLAGLLCDAGGKEVARFESIVKPDGWTIPDEAAGIHGITTETARAQGRPIAEVIDGFDALLAQASMLVAFNIRFDDKLLRGERRRLGRPDGFGTTRVFCCMKGATPLCKMPPTSKMVKAGFTKFKTPKLGEAVQILLKRKHVGAHRAMADVVATKDLFFAMRENAEFMAAGADFKSNATPTIAPEEDE